MDKSRARYAMACFFVLIFSFLYVGLRLYNDFLIGGNPWKQGDWLINSEIIKVRRSFFGNLILSISDWIGAGPLLVTISIQFLFLLFLMFSTVFLLFKNFNKPEFLLLLISPAFFPVFWAADTQGSMRKEVLVFSSFAILLLLSYFRTYRIPLLMISGVLFCMATISNEGLVFFTPIYIYIIILLMKNQVINKVFARASVVATTAVSAIAIIAAVHWQSVDDYLLVCRPLLERGLDPIICDDAILWLEEDIKKNSFLVRSQFSVAKMRDLGISYALSFIPVFAFVYTTNASRHFLVFIMILGMTFFPLYLLGIDWGRWLNFHFTSIVFLLAAMLSLGELHSMRKVSMSMVLAVSFGNLFWAVGHVDPLRQHGLPQEALRAIYFAMFTAN